MKYWAIPLSLIGLVGAQAALSDESVAQTAEEDAFRRDRNVAVRDRDRPEYDAQGLRAGGFLFYPEIQIAAESNSNVFADDANKVSDIVAIGGANAAMKSNWNVHAFNADAFVSGRAYSETSRLNAVDWGVGADMRIDATSRLKFTGLARYENAHEDPSSSPSSVSLEEATPYTHFEGRAGVEQTFNRLRAAVSVSGNDYDYDRVDLTGGGTLLNDERDYQETRAEVRFDYAVSPSTALFVSAEGKKRDYDLDPPAPGALVDRDSEGYEALLGASFDLTRLMTGEVGVGYLSETYEEPGSQEASGVAVNAAVDWYPDPLWTVRVEGRRATEPAGALGALAAIANDVELSADYEFRRNIIFGVAANFERDEYEGVDREDERWGVEITGDYAINRVASLSLRAGRYQQESSGIAAGRDYDIDRVTIGLKIHR